MSFLFGDDNDDERTRASGTRKEAQEPGSPTRGFSRGLLCSLLEMESFSQVTTTMNPSIQVYMN